jgi:hypothetical protein
MEMIFFLFLLIGFFIFTPVALGEMTVSEPTTMLLLGSGLISLAGCGGKKFVKKQICFLASHPPNLIFMDIQ